MNLNRRWDSKLLMVLFLHHEWTASGLIVKPLFLEKSDSRTPLFSPGIEISGFDKEWNGEVRVFRVKTSHLLVEGRFISTPSLFEMDPTNITEVKRDWQPSIFL